MKCRICDCILTDEEATRLDPITNTYLDICNQCYFEDADIDDDLESFDEELND